MEDRPAKGFLLLGFCVHRAWRLSSYWRCASHSSGVQLPSGAMWFWKVQTDSHLQSGLEVSPTGSSLLKWFPWQIGVFCFWRLLDLPVFGCSCTFVFSGGEVQIGTTRPSVTFVLQKLPGFATPSSQSLVTAQRPKYNMWPCQVRVC